MDHLIVSLRSLRPTHHHLHENSLARELNIKPKEGSSVRKQGKELIKAIGKLRDLYGDAAKPVRRIRIQTHALQDVPSLRSLTTFVRITFPPVASFHSEEFTEGKVIRRI